jgi:hypothetical protein
MTVINNIEIDNISYEKNIIKESIKNNLPIENKLNVIIVVSNPCLYARRYILMKEFINRIELEEEYVNLYIVELIYDNQKFIITNSNNKKHLQLKTKVPLWHKENLINLGVKNLLPTNYKAFAWIDADIEFENNFWALDTLKILNGTKDIVQLFSHCVDMNYNKTTMTIFNSAGYSYCKNMPYTSLGKDNWHPGYGYAITRTAYEKIGGLFELGILGSGDMIMMLSLLNNGLKAINEASSDDYKESILLFQEKAKHLRFGYVPGLIRHHFHGTKSNRKYGQRWKILVKHNYSPKEHITKDSKGILIPTNKFSNNLKDEILQYFKERNEDEFYYI